MAAFSNICKPLPFPPSPVWEKAFIVVRFHHAWLISSTIAVSHACFPRPTMPAGQRTAQLDARAGEAIPSLTQTAFTVTTQPSLVLSLYAPRYCLRASAGFGRQFAKLRALSRLRRRYDSRKDRISPFPLAPFRAAGTPWAARHARAAPRSAAPSRRHPCPAGRGFRGC